MEFIVPTEADKSREAIAEGIEKLTSQITLDVDQLKTAIEATNTSNNWEVAASLGATLGGIAAFLGSIAAFWLVFVELRKWRHERDKALSLDLFKLIKEQHCQILSTLAPNSKLSNHRDAWQKVYRELIALTTIEIIPDRKLREEAEQHRTKFRENLKMYLRDSDPKKESLRWQFFTGYEYWENSDDNWKALKPKVTMYSSLSKHDNFGNSDREFLTNIYPEVAVAIFHYAHVGEISLLENIKIEVSPEFNSDDVIAPKKLTKMIKCNINSKVPYWSHVLKMEPPTGLLYFLGSYYKNSNKTDN